LGGWKLLRGREIESFRFGTVREKAFTAEMQGRGEEQRRTERRGAHLVSVAIP
jgi:hypothetical protein